MKVYALLVFVIAFLFELPVDPNAKVAEAAHFLMYAIMVLYYSTGGEYNITRILSFLSQRWGTTIIVLLVFTLFDKTLSLIEMPDSYIPGLIVLTLRTVLFYVLLIPFYSREAFREGAFKGMITAAPKGLRALIRFYWIFPLIFALPIIIAVILVLLFHVFSFGNNNVTFSFGGGLYYTVAFIIGTKVLEKME